MEEEKLSGTSTWTMCDHYGFYFKHWLKTLFVCTKCGTILTKRQISFYKRYNSPEETN